MQVSRHQVLKEVKKSANELGFIDVIRIAMLLGVSVFLSNEFDKDEAAFIEYDSQDDSFFIVVNSKHSAQRQRFSVAHELAHFIYHHDEIKAAQKIGRESHCSMDRESEIQADLFAERILMPTHYVHKFLEEKKVVKKSKLDRKIIQDVAEYFNVSMVACIIRLRKLKYYVPYIELYPY